jgi:hypothetical protein
MSIKSTLMAIALVGAMIAPVACLAQGGGGADGGASGPGGVPSGSGDPQTGAPTGNNSGPGSASPPAPPTDVARTAPPARPVLPPSPAQNGGMTWDGDRLRPNNYRISHPMYPRPRTALTPFDVHPFSRTLAYDGYYDRGCCLVRRYHYGRVLRVRG